MQKKLIAISDGYHNRIFIRLLWNDFCAHSIICRSPSADRYDPALPGRCLRLCTR